jgi:hypothetical protein
MKWAKARVVLPGLPEFNRFPDKVDDIDAIFDFVDNAHQPRVPIKSNEGLLIYLTHTKREWLLECSDLPGLSLVDAEGLIEWWYG